MAFNPFGLGFMIPSAEEIAQAIVAEEELRRSEEELRRSEEELKKKVVRETREGIDWCALRSLNSEGGYRMYPHISIDEEADLIERGELIMKDLVSGTGKDFKFHYHTFYWVDNEREEAKHPAYLRKIAKVEEVAREKGWVLKNAWEL